MASSGAAAALATVAVLAMLAAPSQGNPRTGPPCSECASQCATNCTAELAAHPANCSRVCVWYPPECYSCLDRTYNAYESCCSNGTINAVQSCCDNGCLGDCMTCGPCDVNGLLNLRCGDVCQLDTKACQRCNDAASQQCNDACNSACGKTCVKKGKGN